VTRVLVLNAGSSSLKVSVVRVGTREPEARAQADWGSDATRSTDRHGALKRALDSLPDGRFDVCAHRVVHGGTRFRGAVLVDEQVMAAIDELAELAPLHNPIAAEVLRAQRELLSDVPAVALFDTAFHATLREEAFVYPLPWSWYADWGVRRFGFHGLSVEWSVRRASEILKRPAHSLSLVVAHLGSGCSVTAVLGGESVATSMGFTPLEGVAMGSRSGSVDPGVLFYAQRAHGLRVDDVERALDHDSGLFGVSGLTSDVRQLVDEAAAGNRRAQLALDIFVLRAAEGICAAASNLVRLDALVFTGGIGENSAALRSAICARLAVLNVPALDGRGTDVDAILAGGDGVPAVVRVAAREDLVMAEAATALVR
jgi:acetate kinase